ncbi:rhodanese-like domain-containing protein [Alsobacter sp. R-9]
MFNLFRRAPHPTTTPAQVHERLAQQAITLVDVREPGEYRAERIAGAINIPLSRIAEDARLIPGGKPIILHCLSGARSGRALGLCARLGLPVEAHMAGGISAWKAAGLPVER